MFRKMYIMEVSEFDENEEPETFECLDTISKGEAKQIHARGKPTKWKTVSKNYFHPSSEDAQNLGLSEDHILLIE